MWKLAFLLSHSLTRTVPWHSVHLKNSLNSLKLIPAKEDNNDKLCKTESGNTAFLKQIPSKNYIKNMCKVQDFLIFGWTYTELILLYSPYAEYVLTLLQYQLCLIWCREWRVLNRYENPIVIVITDTTQRIWNFITEIKDASRMSTKLRLVEKYS